MTDMLENIERKLKDYRPQAARGDHMLNPGMQAVAATQDAAVLILLMPRDGGVSVLFIKRASGLKHHAGQISFPGGKRDPGDSDIYATALREAEEELGLPASSVRVIGRLDEYLTRSGFRVSPVVGVAETMEWKPDVSEVEAVFDVPLDHFTGGEALLDVVCEDDRRYYACTYGDHRIWGATAGMLRNLIEVIA